MAASSAEVQPRASTDFVENSILETVVPINPNIDIANELRSWDGAVQDENGYILPFIKQRDVILFDELLPVYIVFRTPLLDDVTFKSYLARLAISVDAFVFSTVPPPAHEPKAPSKELIYSDTIKDVTEPLIVRQEEGDVLHAYAIWKVEVFISRPQGRFHTPSVYFRPAASLKPTEGTKKDIQDDEYLPSRAPTALNLLQAFDNDPALTGIHPRLSAMRISKIAPTTPVTRELTRPIRNGQRPVYRVVPALIWRVRYSKIHTSLDDLSLMAALDLEIPQFSTYNAKVKKIDLTLRGGDAESLADHGSATTAHKPGDQLTYLYKIQPDRASDGTPSLGSKGHYLTMVVEADVFISEDCRPSIAIEWKAMVEFATEQDPNMLKAAHRLSNPTMQAPKILGPDSLPTPDTQNQAGDALKNAINVTLTVSGPPRVPVGEIFHWNVFIVNRSDKARKLAILVMPKRRRDVEKRKSQLSTSPVIGLGTAKKELLTSAVVDENVVYAQQKSARTEMAELVCLTTDIRLGQLSPGSCYTADLKFLALSSGVLSVESVRIIDLATNETADIHNLPSVVAVEKE
ncbi:hypothetical protein P153DRAFT_286183 [Dothidotthia symphoricarpi CBS 119687]|uniref:Trafficking protein particle complex II-specific subunit 65 IgD3 domain-containing protein n=1 Tax=Dothidotthia symphoricarpi CBS 119687 TaxID=1392245 RepID=A0A6A6AKH3_9PLEO|nr:uncharacterized protein P153DRAFT_286183 [Dothidotthia symphoricarpi CBS 119687]KAF2131595.1 hypothetical protein P153DRAFT_286183 [Dothidotthia symphoricarpi CBS 119687]